MRRCRYNVIQALSADDQRAKTINESALIFATDDQRIMNTEFTFTINSVCFDENYHPSDNTRLTTNFANLGF